MAAPVRIEICGRPYRVQFVKQTEDWVGLCSASSGTIKIARKQEPFEERDTLLHEVMHGILRQQGRVYDEVPEELYVRALATGLLGVLRSNPEFVEYLLS